MVEKVGTIRNPLTIIAIFAGIAEISGTVVLPFVALGNQSVYVWFLILFPIFLVLVFFLTLNFNHRVLYAPSDYQNEENFVKVFTPATYLEKAKKLEQELADLEEGEGHTVAPEVVGESIVEYNKASDIVDASVVSAQAKKDLFIRTEDQIFSSIEKQYGTGAFREVRFANSEYIFDGAIFRKDMLVLVEIKILTYTLTLGKLQKTMQKIDESIRRMDREKNRHIHLILALALHGRGSLSQESKAQIEVYQREKDYSLEVKSFDFNQVS